MLFFHLKVGRNTFYDAYSRHRISNFVADAVLVRTCVLALCRGGIHNCGGSITPLPTVVLVLRGWLALRTTYYSNGSTYVVVCVEGVVVGLRSIVH